MAVFNLNLNDDYSKQLLSYYIWGQDTQPPVGKVASDKWIDREENITLKVNTQEFLKKAGNFVNAKDFRLFETFFSGKTVSGNKLNNGNIALDKSKYEKFENGLYFLTQKQFAELFYGEYKNSEEKDEKKAYAAANDPTGRNAASVFFYNRNLDNPDFAKLAFTFGSMKVGLNTSKIRYVLDENLNPILVKDVEYQFNAGDFDFKGGNGSDFANHILNQIADPSGIGKKVALDFKGDNKIIGGTITKGDYEDTKSLEADELQLQDYLKGTYGILAKKVGMPLLKNLLFLVEFNRIKLSGVIDYLDENGKIVMFKGNENDKMVGTKAANFDFDDDVDVEYSLKGFDVAPDALLTKLFELNHFKEHISRGITYVGGKGSDHIMGTDYDDILYGHDKEGKDDDEAADTLIGGKGSDKLYGGKGDDILVGHTGSMIDDDIRDELYGGDGFDTYYVGDKDVIFDSDGKGKVVFEGVELKGGTYDKDKGVYLSKDGLIEYRLNESGGKSTLTVQKGGKSITINEFSKEDKSLGIKLANSKVEVSVTNKEGSANWLKESLGDRGFLLPCLLIESWIRENILK